MMFRSVLIVVLLIAATALAQDRVTPTARPEDTATQQDFERRVSKYLDLRNHLDDAAGKKTASAAEAAAHQKQLAEKVRAQRAATQHGDIFTPQITEFFKRQLKASFRGDNGRRMRASLAHAEPLPKLKLAVNDAYPSQLPLQSTPPSLLLSLPRLPSGIEYRFVGRDLILYDSATNLIVDFLHEALPNY